MDLECLLEFDTQSSLRSIDQFANSPLLLEVVPLVLFFFPELKDHEFYQYYFLEMTFLSHHIVMMTAVLKEGSLDRESPIVKKYIKQPLQSINI